MGGGIEEHISVVLASAVGVAFVDFVESVVVVVVDDDVVAAVVDGVLDVASSDLFLPQ